MSGKLACNVIRPCPVGLGQHTVGVPERLQLANARRPTTRSQPHHQELSRRVGLFSLGLHDKDAPRYIVSPLRGIMNGKTANIFDVSSESRRRLEIMLGLMKNDVERIIRFSNKSLIEDIRWPLIEGCEALRNHIKERREIGFNVSLGISGSGPTIYCLADSEGVANQLGEELHLIWKQQGINSWWFVQEANPRGAHVFHSR